MNNRNPQITKPASTRSQPEPVPQQRLLLFLSRRQLTEKSSASPMFFDMKTEEFMTHTAMMSALAKAIPGNRYCGLND